MGTAVVVFAAAVGLALGSFLNVAISRLPRGESLLAPPSHCTSCGRRLAWWENIPIASYILLMGRCRTCEAPIGWRHLAVELAAGAAAAWGASRLVLLFSPEGQGSHG